MRISSLRATVRSSAFSGTLLVGGALVFSCAARADVYYAVTGQETLSSVAARYNVSTQSLRQANGLSSSDAAPLGAMLLRIPGVQPNQQAALSAPLTTPSFQTPRTTGRGAGSLSRAVYDTARPGDTWETIAQRFRAAGNEVSVESLRHRNGDIAAPVSGQSIIVPLGQLSFAAAPSEMAPRVPVDAPVGRPQTFVPSEPRALGGGVYASGEFDMGAPANTGRSYTIQTPLAGSRGPLASRGGYGDMRRQALGGDVRVLGSNEDANAPRVRPGVDAATSTQPVYRPSGSLARVGQVSLRGARIRRLPQSAAITLFNCAVGTRLAVLRQSGGWSAVLMSDGSTGWVPSKYLQLTEQTTDVSSLIVATPGPGGSARYGGGLTRYAAASPYVAQALRWLGTPYVYGGTGRRGIDCSSLVQHAFAACGISLPRTAAQQARVGMAVGSDGLQAGDRLYFSASGTRIDHTGLYMGNGLFVHASGSGHRVMVSNLFEPRNWNIFVGARR